MWDHDLFLWLNFDGGAVVDSIMQFTSGRLSWIPLYLLILALIWWRKGWQRMLLAAACIGIGVGVADIIAGIFKQVGLLGDLLPDFPARLRPMHTEGVKEFTHFLRLGSQNGTVSAHAATSFSIGVVAVYLIRLRWFSIIMWTQVAMVCYSRIYLGYHFPQDILLGLFVGAVSSLFALLLYEFLQRRMVVKPNKKNGK